MLYVTIALVLILVTLYEIHDTLHDTRILAVYHAGVVDCMIYTEDL